jgi:hypothetical protein
MRERTGEFWFIFVALMFGVLHGSLMEERYLACRTSCECRYISGELVVKCRGENLYEVPQGIPQNVTEL